MFFAKKTVLASLLVLSTGSAFAADDATLAVTGKISSGACNINFAAGGGVIEYGDIDPNTLNFNAPTSLASQDMGYTITCGTAMKIATFWEDQRADSSRGPQSFGLGKHEGKAIGYYEVGSRSAVTIDNGGTAIAAGKRGSVEDGAWIKLESSTPLLHPETLYMSYVKNENGSEIVASKTYTGTLVVKTVINATQTLDMGSKVTLDGLSTINLKYF